VQLNYPEITDVFGPRLLFLFPQFLGEERTLALEILAGRAAHLPDLLQSLQGLNFLGCLKHKYVTTPSLIAHCCGIPAMESLIMFLIHCNRDEATQFASLSIIYGLCDSLKPAQIKYLLDTLILEFSNHSSVECRVR